MRDGERPRAVTSACARIQLDEQGWEHPLDVVIELVAHGQATSVTLTESGFCRARTPHSLLREHEEGWRYHWRD